MALPVWTLLHPKMTVEMLGYIPYFLEDTDPRPAREQINERYNHGGGWVPMPGFELVEKNGLAYPGDPVLYPLAVTKLRDETIRYYPLSWVAITQPDGTWEVARLD